MSAFGERLRSSSPRSRSGRTWLYVPYDQLTDRVGPLSNTVTGEIGIVLVECPGKAKRRPYHKQKLALILANQRHFALEQARRGVAVRYEVAERSYLEAIERVADEVGPLRAMRPAERELRSELRPAVDAGAVRWIEHTGWLTTREQFEDSQAKGPPYRMDRFYRHVRRATGILMDDGKPEGGRFSFDGENRERWTGTPPAPEPPTFEPDAVTREVGELVERRFGDHPGRLDLSRLPATADDARASWRWALDRCLESFGPYEDAMSVASTTLFHTRVSGLVHLHRLLPREVVDDVAGADAPLRSREGFVRQVLGWREFMRHVHDATDGFRRMSGDTSRSDDAPAAPSALGAGRPLPGTFWGRPSGLHCLDTVVESVWTEGYSHHITRLMVLSNLATLLDVSPRELTDWFWAAYTDAFDWVVEPNVLGMGTYGVGDLFTTKPYVSGAAYLRRMSDYCSACSFDPQRDCPITSLYWAFLDRHRDALDGNPRMRLPLRSLDGRDAERRAADRATFERVSETLARGEPLCPPDDGRGSRDGD